MSPRTESTSEDPDGASAGDPDGATSAESHGESGVHPEADADLSSRLGHVLAVVLVGTLVLGLLRPFYPTASALGLGAFLALFGVFIGVLAFRERGRES